MMMPEEIKRGLKCLSVAGTAGCISVCSVCNLRTEYYSYETCADALNYIKQLETKIIKLKEEKR